MFSMRLKALREAKEISQRTLAVFLHYSQQSIAKWESGDSVPPADVLARIAKYFNVSVDYLLGQDLQVKEIPGDYATAKDLVMRLISYPAIARHAAFALESLSENELSLFADDVLAMITIAAKRFDNQ
jgi:transcriptional regulator with XRE-family HTH domain